jgi:hypothetical protein
LTYKAGVLIIPKHGKGMTIVKITTREVNHGRNERKAQIQFCLISGVDCCHNYLRIVLLQSILKIVKSVGRGNK